MFSSICLCDVSCICILLMYFTQYHNVLSLLVEWHIYLLIYCSCDHQNKVLNIL